MENKVAWQWKNTEQMPQNAQRACMGQRKVCTAGVHGAEQGIHSEPAWGRGRYAQRACMGERKVRVIQTSKHVHNHSVSQNGSIWNWFSVLLSGPSLPLLWRGETSGSWTQVAEVIWDEDCVSRLGLTSTLVLMRDAMIARWTERRLFHSVCENAINAATRPTLHNNTSSSSSSSLLLAMSLWLLQLYSSTSLLSRHYSTLGRISNNRTFGFVQHV